MLDTDINNFVRALFYIIAIYLPRPRNRRELLVKKKRERKKTNGGKGRGGESGSGISESWILKFDANQESGSSELTGTFYSTSPCPAELAVASAMQRGNAHLSPTVRRNRAKLSLALVPRAAFSPPPAFFCLFSSVIFTPVECLQCDQPDELLSRVLRVWMGGVG